MTEKDRETIEIAHEVATFGKRRVVTGRVRVRATTEAYEATASGVLEGEDVEVERVSMNVYVDAPPAVRTEGDLTIVPVVEEVLVVEKRLMLIEEVHIRRVATAQAVEEPVTLRRQRAIVERIDPQSGEILLETDSNQ